VLQAACWGGFCGMKQRGPVVCPVVQCQGMRDASPLGQREMPTLLLRSAPALSIPIPIQQPELSRMVPTPAGTEPCG